jgi:D-alanyl-D-alanine carboxypeptidase
LNKKTLIIIISSFVVLIMLSGVIFLGIASIGGQAHNRPAMAQESDAKGDDTKEDSDYTYISPTPAGDSKAEDSSSDLITEEAAKPFVPATELDLDPSSITVFVNKEYALPKDYKPEQLITPDVIFNLVSYDERTLMRPEAAHALEKLFNNAKLQGIILYGVSAYRSYERQYTIFTDNIAKKGKDYTLRYSAVPGTSEHQTGLSIDVSAKSENFNLDDNFASSPEGKWLADNAYKYGYIIRYPKGNEDITGYAFEPWHIRYVGEELANYLYTNKLTLEEYYQYTPSPDFSFETKYADIINYVPPVVTKPPVVSGPPKKGDDKVTGKDGKVKDNGEEIPPVVSPTVTPSGKGPKVTKAPENEEEGTVTEIPAEPTITPNAEEPGSSEEEQGSTPEEGNDATQDPGSETPGSNNGVTPTPAVPPTEAP